jgi:hypothetical protein
MEVRGVYVSAGGGYEESRAHRKQRRPELSAGAWHSVVDDGVRVAFAAGHDFTRELHRAGREIPAAQSARVSGRSTPARPVPTRLACVGWRVGYVDARLDTL